MITKLTQQNSCYNWARQVEDRLGDRREGKIKASSAIRSEKPGSRLFKERLSVNVNLLDTELFFGGSLCWTSCHRTYLGTFCPTPLFGLQLIYDTTRHIPQSALYYFYMLTTACVIPSCKQKVNTWVKYIEVIQVEKINNRFSPPLCSI